MTYPVRDSAEQNTSVLHRMNTAVKLLCLLMVCIAVFKSDTPAGLLSVSAFTAALIYLSQLEFGEILLRLGRLWVFFVGVFLLNTCFFDQRRTELSFLIFTPSLNGAIKGLFSVMHCALTVAVSGVFFSTTDRIGLVSAFSILLSPLKILGVPADESAFILSAALDFVPELLRETERAAKTSELKGQRPEKKKRGKNEAYFRRVIIPAVVVVFQSAAKRADSMEARGFDGRTGVITKRDRKLELCDVCGVLVCFAVCAMQFVMI